MLGMLLLFVAALQRQPGLVKYSFHSLFSRLKRSYSDASSDLLTELLMLIIHAGSLTMLLYAIFFVEGHFSLLFFGMMMAVSLLFWVLKFLLIRMISYVFSIQLRSESPMDAYSQLWVFSSVLLYPMMVLLINTNWTVLAAVVLGVTLSVQFVLVFIRLFRLFAVNPLSILYILLYIVTLEILPICALGWGIHAVLS